MSLSDNERYECIAHIVSSLSNLKRLDRRGSIYDRAPKFNKLLNSLWPAFIGGKSNSAHWIMGSESNQSWQDDFSLLGAAFKSARDELLVKKEEPKEDEKDWEYCKNYALCASRLLNNGQETVWSIYTRSESYFYYANRYDDKFSKKLKPLTDIITKLVGLCFDEFKDNSNYMTAWMMEQMFDKVLLPNRMVYDGEFIVKWFMSDHLLHDIKIPTQQENKIAVYETFKDWQPRPPFFMGSRKSDKYNLERDPNRDVVISTDEKMKLVFLLLGDSAKFNYEHQHKQLYTMIEEHNKKNKKDKIDLDWVKKACADIIVKKAKKDKEMYGSYKHYCNFTDQSI